MEGVGTMKSSGVKGTSLHILFRFELLLFAASPMFSQSWSGDVCFC
jgi:hypothetical protein